MPKTVLLLAAPFHCTHARRWLPRRSRRARLPWLRCLHCGKRLVQIDVHDGWTALRLGARAWSHGSEDVLCACGTVRKFHPRPVG